MIAYFVSGRQGLAVGSIHNLYFQGDNYLVLVPSRNDSLKSPRLESSRHHLDATAVAQLEGELVGNGASGTPVGFASIQLPKAGCWTVRISMGTAELEYTLYAYPWDCRPAEERGFPPPPGVTAEPCTQP
jgi:hypothetical protein